MTEAQEAVVTAREVFEFFSRAGMVLAGSLDLEETLARVVDLVVPEVADWCGLLLVAEEGAEREITSRHPDPELEEMIVVMRRRRRTNPETSESLRVIATGESILATDVRGIAVPDATEEQRVKMARLAARSYMIVPFVVRGRAIGSLTLLSTREGRHYAAADLVFAESLGERVALAIENARLYEAVHAALAREREGRLRADFLANAGAMLDASLDYEQTLANVAQIAVPEIADWCAVSVIDESGSLREVAAAHVDPAKRAIARELNERFPTPPDADTGAPGVARSGRTEYIPEISDELIVASVRHPDQLDLVRRLELRSLVTAPLIARGRTLGAITLASAESRRLFEDADVQLAEELARRAGVAIDNARLYTERTRIAHTLQARLLPERLPEIPNTQIAARYRAAGELNEVGGDFYDVFARSSSEWAMVVGDVSGKGAEAAAITALARYTLRAVAMEELSPSQALLRLNQAMLTDGSSQFATVVLAYVAQAPDGLRIRLSLGGHPPPLLLRADGEVEAAGTFGGLLGLLEAPRLHDTTAALAPGDVMLLYTDGVTEAGPRDAPFGQSGLASLLQGLAGREPQRVVDAVESAAVGAQSGEPRDDIALLALRAGALS
ncbi:MAG: SpoIIE family protein phosphatase [Actinomycetota bacterium]|nr:SpoIIE family protein phosphatase [Actinomycetota bacterium]